MADNWIVLSRKILDHWIWSEQPFSKGQAWVDLLLMANYKDKKVPFDGGLVLVKRGSLITSQVKLAERWKWDRKTVKSFLKLLENDGMITFSSTTKWTTITIVNYRDFQDYGSADWSTDGQQGGQQWDSELDNSGTANWTQHNKETKETKKQRNKETIIYSDIAEFNAALASFIEYRKRIKKPMTDRAIELLIKKLESLSSDVDEQIAILNQSELNGWAGVFPLKDKKPKDNGSRLDWIDEI